MTHANPRFPVAMPKSRGGAVIGCLTVLITAGLIVQGCNALFGIEDSSPPATNPTPTTVTTAPAVGTITPIPTPTPTRTRKPKPPPDLDDDGIPDRKDRDADGDGVRKSADQDDRDSDVGRPEPEPEPEPEPAVGNAHPGGFCGNEGATGMASNGRMYTCRGGHWRR